MPTETNTTTLPRISGSITIEDQTIEFKDVVLCGTTQLVLSIKVTDNLTGRTGEVVSDLPRFLSALTLALAPDDMGSAETREGLYENAEALFTPRFEGDLSHPDLRFIP